MDKTRAMDIYTVGMDQKNLYQIPRRQNSLIVQERTEMDHNLQMVSRKVAGTNANSEIQQDRTLESYARVRLTEFIHHERQGLWPSATQNAGHPHGPP